MLMILAFHATRIGCTDTSQSFYVYFSGVLFGSWGLLGVDIFVIISSYFLVEQKFRSQKLIYIAFQTFTYVFMYLIASFLIQLVQSRDIIFSAKSVLIYILNCLREPFWSNNYWFVTSYFFMLLCSPFLNYIISHSDKTQFKKLLLILLFIPIYSQFNTSVIGDIICFCYIYLLVGYLKKYGKSLINCCAKLKFIVAVFCVIISGKIAVYFSIPKIVKGIIYYTVSATGRHSVIILVLALMICFAVFKKKAFYNPFINQVALCTLGVYLLHEQSLIGFSKSLDCLLYKCMDFGLLDFGWLFPLQYILIIIAIYIFATVFEYVRLLLIQKPFMKLISTKCSKRIKRFDDWMNNM